MDAVTLVNDGKGNFKYANDGDELKYTWPLDGSKLTFVAWYGDNVSVDASGNITYSDNSSQQDVLVCKTAAMDYGSSATGKVIINLEHAYSYVTFKSGKYFTPKTVEFDGRTYDVSKGAVFVNSGSLASWATSRTNTVTLPEDKRSYFHIKGYWNQSPYSRDMEFYVPVPSTLSLFEGGKKYEIECMDEFMPYFGYKSDGTPYWIYDIPVDLGLSVKWSRCSLGADKYYHDDLYGDVYQWAGTSPQINDGTSATPAPYWTSSQERIYSSDGQSYTNSFTKYNGLDNKTTLDLSDDAAYVQWGSPWRMPTFEEFQELMDENNITINGAKYTSKVPGYEGNSIYLWHFHPSRYPKYNGQGLWTSTWHKMEYTLSDGTYYISRSSYVVYSLLPDSYDDRKNGFAIRPVCK